MITEPELLELLAHACANAGGGRAWAEQHGLAFSSVYEALKGNRGPGTLIPAALGYEPVTMYQKIKQGADK